MLRRLKDPLVLAIAAASAARLAWAGWTELAPDEAYYARWGAVLRAPDHPPAIGLLVAAATALFGQSERAVRLVPIVCGALTALAVRRLARGAGVAPAAATGAGLVATFALLPAAGAVIATPDAPLLLCWTVAAALLLDALAHGTAPRWIAFGAAAGLGLWCKLSALLLWPAVLAIPAARRTPRRIALAAATAAVVAAPPIAAELAAGLGAVRFQLAHAYGPAGGPLWGPAQRLLEAAAAQVGLLSPIVAWEAARFVGRPRAALAAPTAGALHALALLPLCAFALSAVVRRPEPNWLAPAYPALVVGAVAAWQARAPARRALIGAIGLSIAIATTLVVHVHAVRPFLPLPPARDPTSRLHGWSALARAAGPFHPRAAEDYGVAAELWWYGEGHPDVRVARPTAAWRTFRARRADGAVVRTVKIR